MDQEKQSFLLSSCWIFLQFAIKISLKSKERSKFLQNISVARMLPAQQQSSFTLDIHLSKKQIRGCSERSHQQWDLFWQSLCPFFDLLDRCHSDSESAEEDFCGIAVPHTGMLKKLKDRCVIPRCNRGITQPILQLF